MVTEAQVPLPAAGADQVAADADQTAANADQSASDADQVASDSDKLSARQDQEASDRDQAAADRIERNTPDATPAQQAEFDRARRERDAVSAYRIRNRRERANASAFRGLAADDRDATGTEREQTSDARDDRGKDRSARAEDRTSTPLGVVDGDIEQTHEIVFDEATAWDQGERITRFLGQLERESRLTEVVARAPSAILVTAPGLDETEVAAILAAAWESTTS